MRPQDRGGVVIGPHVADARPDVDRVLVAAALANDGEHSAASAILHSVTHVSATTERLFARVRGLLADWDELSDRLQMCADDVKHYIDLFVDERPGYWPVWREEELNRLVGEADQVLADARMHAEQIVHAWPSAVAS